MALLCLSESKQGQGLNASVAHLQLNFSWVPLPPFPNRPLPQTPHPSSLITKSYYSGKRFGNREMEY